MIATVIDLLLRHSHKVSLLLRLCFLVRQISCISETLSGVNSLISTTTSHSENTQSTFLTLSVHDPRLCPHYYEAKEVLSSF
jgi:hypothetical protein